MVIACWSVKGGSGTTVVAAALALRLARTHPPVLLADMAGDVPAALGRPEPAGPGLHEWLAAGPDVAADALERLAVSATPGLAIIAAGAPDRGRPTAGLADGERLVHRLTSSGVGAVVIDCGSQLTDAAIGVAATAERSLLVIRPCFLAVRRALAAPVRPSAVVLVEEPHRSLSERDVADVLGVPVIAVPWDPAISRALDAGLLAARLPRTLDRALAETA